MRNFCGHATGYRPQHDKRYEDFVYEYFGTRFYRHLAACRLRFGDGGRPRELYRLYPDRLEVEDASGRRALPGPPLDRLREVLGGVKSAPGPVPFTGGFVGYFGYDFARLADALRRESRAFPGILLVGEELKAWDVEAEADAIERWVAETTPEANRDKCLWLR